MLTLMQAIKRGTSEIANLASPAFVLDPANAASGLTVSADGYTVTRSSAAATYKSVRSIASCAQSGLVMVTFWPGMDGGEIVSLTEPGFGICTGAMTLSAAGYSATESVWWAPNGAVYAGTGASIGTAPVWRKGVQADAVFNLTSKLFWGRVNNGYWNNNASGDPDGGVGGYTYTLNAGNVYAFACLYSPDVIMRSKFVQVAAPTPPATVTFPFR